jgi:hypothetical protein
MAEQQRINAASRLHKILQAAVGHSQQATQLQVWATVFEVQSLSGRQQKEAVAKGIILLFGQLDRIVEYLRAAGHPENTYRELVSLMEQNVLIELINHPWQDYRTRLAHALYPLAILSNFLPDEEISVDPSEFQGIREELDELEKTLEQKEISPDVRAFVKRQIETIRNAMWEYKFRGAQVFRDAMVKAFTDPLAGDVVAKHPNDSTIKKTGNVWQRVIKLMDATIKIQAALTALQKIYQLAEGIIHHH